MPGKKIVLPSYWTNDPDGICFGVQRNIFLKNENKHKRWKPGLENEVVEEKLKRI